MGGSMATNLAIDQKILLEAQRIGCYKTKRETVNAALEEFIRHRKQLEIIDLFGKVEFDPKYDYKQGRKNRASSG